MIKFYLNNVDIVKLSDKFNYKYEIPSIPCEDGIIVNGNAFDKNRNMLNKSENELFENAEYEFCWNTTEPAYNIIEVE